MKVYVVMSNDCPDSVFDDKIKADAYVNKRKQENEVEMLRCYARKVYWNCYEFKLNQEGY